MSGLKGDGFKAPVHRHDFRDELKREQAEFDREWWSGVRYGFCFGLLVGAILVGLIATLS